MKKNNKTLLIVGVIAFIFICYITLHIMYVKSLDARMDTSQIYDMAMMNCVTNPFIIIKLGAKAFTVISIVLLIAAFLGLYIYTMKRPRHEQLETNHLMTESELKQYNINYVDPIGKKK